MIGFVNEKHLFFLRPVHNGPLMEQMIGIEPTSPTWKDGVITIIRHLLKSVVGASFPAVHILSAFVLVGLTNFGFVLQPFKSF